LQKHPSLEAQLCNLADEIAYNAHDIDDGVRSGLLHMEQLREVPVFREYHDQALLTSPHLLDASNARRWIYETIRLMLSEQVYDVIRTVEQQLLPLNLRSVQEVRQHARLIVFSAEMREKTKALKAFLFANLYRHPQVIASREVAKAMLRDLFEIYSANPGEMQAGYANKAMQVGDDGANTDEVLLRRVVADYVSGMTDRFAAREHARLNGVSLLAS
jgi:dGTPase